MQITPTGGTSPGLNTDAAPAPADLRSTGGSSGVWTGSSAPTGPNWKALEKRWKAELQNLELQISLAQYEGNDETLLALYREVQQLAASAAERYRKAGFSSDSTEVLTWLKRGGSYAEKEEKLAQSFWDRLADAIQDLADAADRAEVLAEKQQAVADAREALQRVTEQRTVRLWNDESDQWEWVADEGKVSDAQAKLARQEALLHDARIKAELQDLRSADPSDGLNLGPELSALLASLPADALTELADAVGTFTALNGDGSLSQLLQPDSAGTTNNFYFPGGITLTDAQAQGLTLADLAAQLEEMGVM